MSDIEKTPLMIVTDRGILVEPPLNHTEISKLIVARALVPEFEAEVIGPYEDSHIVVLFERKGQDRRPEAAFCIKLAELRGTDPPREFQPSSKHPLRIAG